MAKFGFLGKVAKAAGSVVSFPVKVAAKVVAAPIKLTGKITGIKAIKAFGRTTEKVANPFTVAKAVTKVTGKVAASPFRLVGKVTGVKAFGQLGQGIQGSLSTNPIAAAKASLNIAKASATIVAKTTAAPIRIVGKVTKVKAIKKIGNVVEGVSNPFTVLRTTGKVTGKIAVQAKKIPIVGKPLAAVINLGSAPIRLVNSAVEGERIDQAVLKNLKEQAKSVKEIAPYARMCVSLIPGVGTVAAAAIAAGAAIAEGQPITAVMVAGIKGAIPGGMIAQSAFSISYDAVSGKSLTTAALNSLNLNSQQKSAAKTVISLSKDLSIGKSINKPNLAKAQSLLPIDVQKAINIGTAVAFGQKNQKKVIPNPNFKPTIQSPVEKMVAEGNAIIAKSPIFKAGLTTLATAADKHGYAAAIGMMSHKATEAEISKFHAMLPKADDHGFTIGCAVVIGIKLIVAVGNDLQDFGAAVAKGINGAKQETKVAVVRMVASNEVAAVGVMTVASENKKSWLHKLLVKMGFLKEMAA